MAFKCIRQDIIDHLEAEVRKRCESKEPFFGMGVFCHIKAVAEHAVFLAEE